MTSQELRQLIGNVSEKAGQLADRVNALAVAALDGAKLQPGTIAGLLADQRVAQLQLVELQRRLKLAEDADLAAQIADLSAQEAALAAQMAPLGAQMTELEREYNHLSTSPVNDIRDAEIKSAGIILQAKYAASYNEKYRLSVQRDDLRGQLRARGAA